MNYELSQKTLAWLIMSSALMGYLAGLVYELPRLRRHAVRLGKIAEAVLVSIEDVCFFVVWSAFFCILLYAGSNGEVRIEAIFAQLAGFLMFRKTLGRLAGKLWVKIPSVTVKNVRIRQILSKIFVKRTKTLKIKKKRKVRDERKR